MVWLTALILTQMKLELVSEAMLSAMETRLEGMVAKVMEMATSSLRMLVDTTTAEIKAASMDVVTSAMKIAVSASSYQDVLKSAPGPGNGANTMDIHLWAREGVKARQLLIDTRAPGLGLLPGISNAGLADAANDVIRGMDSTESCRFVSARRLNNGGVLLELNDNAAATWINNQGTRTAFSECFAPNAVVKS